MNWHYISHDKQFGPVGDPEIHTLIRSGQITRVTPVWNENMTDWLPADRTELVSEFKRVPATPPPPPLRPQPQCPPPPSDTSTPKTQGGNFPFAIVGGVVLIGIGIIGLATDSFSGTQARGFLYAGIAVMAGYFTFGKGK
jgi:hypothetical protein